MKKQILNYTTALLSLFVLGSWGSNLAQEQPQNQKDTETVLSQLFSSGDTFDEITAAADNHFRIKYPNAKKADLCEGNNRDGDYVKYQRWKAFWKNHLNEDGTLGDFTRNNQTQIKSGLKSGLCDGDEFLVNWTNSNYNANMGWQIDLGRTSSMAFHPSDPDTYYVGAAFGGLWKTTNGGGNYTLLNDELPLSAVSGIAIDPNNPDHIAIALSDILWYGPAGIGVYVSTDGGTTFQPTSLTWSLSDGERIYYMDQDPFDGDKIMIATNAGIYKTDDFFATSTEVLQNDMRHITYSQSSQGLVFAGGANGEFYRSTDGGGNFNLVTDFGGDHVRIAVPLASTNSSRVVATMGNTLYRSTDDGQTFDSRTMPESDMVIEFEPGSENVLNGGNFEAYSSNDFGDSFTTLTHWYGQGGLPWIHVDQRNIFVNPLEDDQVYFCNDGGIFRYDNSLQEFDNLSSDLIITQYYDIAVSQTDAMVLGAGSQDNGNVFRESNGSWNRYAQTGDGMGQDIHPTDPNIRYWSYQFGGIRRWENGTNTPIAPAGLDGTGAWETPFKIDPNDPDGIFIGYEEVYYSSDKGDNWTNLGMYNVSGNLEQLAIAPSNSEQIYATRGNQLFVKVAGSPNWNVFSTPMNGYISDLEVDFEDKNTVYISYTGYSDGMKVFKSTDAGQNWTNISDNLPNLPMISLELYDNQNDGVFVGSYGAVYYRDNSTTEWRKMGCLPNTAVNDIEIQYDSDRIFAATHGRGIFEADIAFDVATITQEEFDQSPRLLMAYPNPAIEVLSIQAKRGSLSESSVNITDLLGRKHQPEIHFMDGEIKIDCSELSAGHYIVHVIDEQGTISNLKFTKQ